MPVSNEPNEGREAAQYLLGVAGGLATDRSVAWHNRLRARNLKLVMDLRAAIHTAHRILHDGGAWSPVEIWAMVDVAKRLGFGETMGTLRQEMLSREIVEGGKVAR